MRHRILRVRTSNCKGQNAWENRKRRKERREESWPARRETVKIYITIVDRNNYARSARANGRGSADANADARRGREAWGDEIEKRLAGNTTRNSDTRYTKKRKKTRFKKREAEFPCLYRIGKNKRGWERGKFGTSHMGSRPSDAATVIQSREIQ